MKEGWPAFKLRFNKWKADRKIKRTATGNILAADGTEIPPPELSAYVGGGDFLAVGNALLGQLIGLCGLKPNEAVLDVGCGIGRIAVPLTKYLDRTGRYEGFDIVKQGIDWCNVNISKKYPNFHFQLAGIYNKAYNPAGETQAREYVFPYSDGSFDLVFLTSVFTHMLPEDMGHYMREIKRVLKPGGRCFVTFFLLDNGVHGLIKQGKSTLNFVYGSGISRYDDENAAESAIAYEENYIRDLYGKTGLQICEPIYRGSWCGRGSFPEYEGKGVMTSYQDIIIAGKPG
jgi:ubiquinone/menaquinone biosynthesis C-methylase UbiE